MFYISYMILLDAYNYQISYIYIMSPHRIKERTSHLFDHFIDYKMMRDARMCVWEYT